tara:strand:+ start:91 stop:639 length:549 start_codon:yes stop_codon:yes gene_type:complete
MKSKRTDLELRYILLFKLDARNLYNRIVKRRHEYVEIFSLKRNRAIFKEIFDNRYSKSSTKDLSYCSIEVIESLDSFYTAVDEIYWYLKTTQDMPNTIEDEVHRRINSLARQYDMLSLYIDAVLTGSDQTSIESFDELSPASEDIHNDSFQMDGEAQEEADEEEYIQPEQYPDLDEEEEHVD